MPLPLALTCGEPASIAPEITAAAWAALRHAGAPFFLIGDAAILPPGTPHRLIQAPEQAAAAFPTALPVLHRPLPTPATPGTPQPGHAPAIIAAITEAVALARAGRIGALVTNPINKAALYAEGFAHPGHTEFLAELDNLPHPPVMMLASPMLRVVPVTIHEPLAAAIARLTPELIIEQSRITHAALRARFGIAAPRLAIAGLNPHAGESGTLGREEITIIAPAIAALRAEGIDASGPWPPDTLFTAKSRPRYDVAICLYHDQALIPIKALDMEGGVNVTLGLSFLRTSPDHGTALDIAGKGLADAASLIAALRLAGVLAARQAAPAEG